MGLLFYIIHPLEQPLPADATEATAIGIAAPPDEDGLAHHMVFRHKTPVAGLGRVMTVITHHPVIVHLERLTVGLLAVDEDLSVLHLQVVTLIDTDWTVIDGDILQ